MGLASRLGCRLTSLDKDMRWEWDDRGRAKLDDDEARRQPVAWAGDPERPA